MWVGMVETGRDGTTQPRSFTQNGELLNTSQSQQKYDCDRRKSYLEKMVASLDLQSQRSFSVIEYAMPPRPIVCGVRVSCCSFVTK